MQILHFTSEKSIQLALIKCAYVDGASCGLQFFIILP